MVSLSCSACLRPDGFRIECPKLGFWVQLPAKVLGCPPILSLHALELLKVSN